MNQVHLFDVSDAVKYGVSEAIFIYRIQRWINDNAISDRDYVFRDGRYWSYSPRDQILKANPYFTAKKLQRIVKKLKEENVLEARCDMNQSKVDRTMWYTFTVDEYKRRITLNNTYIEPKQSESDIKPKGQMQEDNLSTPMRTNCPHEPAKLAALPYEIKNKIKKEIETAKIESDLSNNANEKIKSDNCLSFEKINPQDENAKEVIKKWDKQDALPKVKYNHMIFMNLCVFISNQEKRGIYTSDLLKCVENYAKAISHPKTWRKSKLTIQAFFGLNRAKPCFEPFIDQMFDINDSLKEREESEEERLRNVMLRSGMSKEEIDSEIEKGYKIGFLK